MDISTSLAKTELVRLQCELADLTTQKRELCQRINQVSRDIELTTRLLKTDDPPQPMIIDADNWRELPVTVLGLSGFVPSNTSKRIVRACKTLGQLWIHRQRYGLAAIPGVSKSIEAKIMRRLREYLCGIGVELELFTQNQIF